MTVIFRNSIPGQFLNYTLRGGISSVSVTIYGGVQPSAATVSSSWSSYNSTYLFHSVNNSTTVPNAGTAGPSTWILSSSTSGTALNSGTATWAIIWITGTISESTLQGATIPNSGRFMLCPVSANGGTGIVQLSTTTITASSSYNITQISLSALGGLA